MPPTSSPVDPVKPRLLGQLELDALVKAAAEKRSRDDARKAPPSRPDLPARRRGDRRRAGARAGGKVIPSGTAARAPFGLLQ